MERPIGSMLLNFRLSILLPKPVVECATAKEMSEFKHFHKCTPARLDMKYVVLEQLGVAAQQGV